MIKKSTHKPITASQRPATSAVNRNVVNSRPINAARNITAGVQNRRSAVNSFKGLTKEQSDFVRVIQSNLRKEGRSITAATNTANIAAKPDFLELVPLFTQKLLVTDVFGTIAMNSRAQFIPFFKFVAENEKGETAANSVLSSPFANNQGKDPNFTGRLVKNEQITFTAPAAGNITADSVATTNIIYTPILPGTVSISVGNKVLADTNGDGILYDGNTAVGEINYAVGGVSVEIGTGKPLVGVISNGDTGYATYQYDNETIGNDPKGYGTGHNYGAKMARGNLVLDDITLTAEARELACYWSVYAAFATQKEYGANLADTAKEAAISEITAEINSDCFQKLAASAQYAPQFNFDASPVLSGAVYPTDYLNQIKLKLGQAKMAIYQATRLSTPNRLVVGTTAANYLSMVNGFTAEGSEEHVGPYKLGRLDDFEIYVDPNFDPQLWVMACKSNDIRRNSALFGEYMPITTTEAIGLANASVQQGYATMYAAEVVNPATVVSGRILGTY